MRLKRHFQTTNAHEKLGQSVKKQCSAEYQAKNQFPQICIFKHCT